MYPWVLVLTGAFYGPVPAPLLPPWAAFGLLVSGHAVVRWAVARPWPLQRVRLAVAGTGLAAGLAAVKMTYYPGHAAWDVRWIAALLLAAHDALPDVVPPVMGALTAALLWWRGVVLGERDFTHFEIERAFRRGVAWTVLFTIFFVIYGDSRGFAAAQASPAYLLGFFSLSLIMLAVTRALSIWQESQADDTQALAANRHWLLLLIGMVGLIISGAAALSGAVNIQFRPVVLRWLRLLEPVVEALFLALFAVALVVAKGIIFILSRLPYRAGRIEPPPGLSQPLSALLRQLPPRLVGSARWGMVLLGIGLLTVLIAVAVVRARRRLRKVDEDERESVWSTPSLLGALAQAWRTLWTRRPSLGYRESPGVNEIRALYRRMLRVGADLDVPREPYQTPYEYQPRLAGRLPEHTNDIADVTETYVRVRYTPHAPPPDETDRARDAIGRIEQAISVLRE